MIGVLDSGVGGVTVLREIIKRGINAKFIYYSDLVNNPYGDKTDKTITVLIESYKVHPLYGKRVKYSKKYAAHDELNEAKVGDLVRIEECRPMSKTKKFRLVEIVEKAVII